MRMRVISGWLGSRLFDAPDSSITHPMSERVRGAMFNSLGDIDNLHVLDPFSGTGALSFEAISRGAATVLAIEKDRRAQLTIAKNIDSLKVGDQVKLVKNSCAKWSVINLDKLFDLIVCDPPYDKLQLEVVELLAKHLKPQGTLVLSYPGRQPAPKIKGLEVQDTAFYGDAALAYYRLQNY